MGDAVISTAQASAPGKLILSGEHAVVYGRPALVAAVNQRVYAAVQPHAENWLVSYEGWDAAAARSVEELSELCVRLDTAYEQFLEGALPITEVVGSPMNLLQYALGVTLAEARAETDCGRMHLEGEIPIGSGMGSSAACILALCAALDDALGRAFDPESLRKRVDRTEAMQHGKPSGVDAHTCLHGGMHVFAGGKARRVDMHEKNLLLVDTGAPASSTGECVMQVADRFSQSALWVDFEAVTARMEQALIEVDHDALRDAVRLNHRLLVEIGVVPQPVGAFVEQVESAGGAAKLCGAGAVRGTAGGILWVTGLDTDLLNSLAGTAGFTTMETTLDLEGVRVHA